MAFKEGSPSDPLVLDYSRGTIEDAIDVAAHASEEGLSGLAAEMLCRWGVEQPFGMPVVVRGHDGVNVGVVAFVVDFLIRPSTAARIARADEPFDPLNERHTVGLFMTDQEVGRANAGEGGVLFGAMLFISSRLSEADRRRVHVQILTRFAEFYVGNRVQEILILAQGRWAAEAAVGFGFELVNDYAAWSAQRGVPEDRRPFLFRAAAERGRNEGDLNASRMFQYRPPALRLPLGAREILRFALAGVSDAQVAARYGISPASLNSRWTRIFDIAERRLPSILETVEGTKGRDRQSILAYVRQHPEELWPYDPPRG